MKRLISLLACLGAVLAAPWTTLPEPAVWLEPAGGRLYALAASGTVWRIHPGGRIERLGGRWAPGFLTTCEGVVFGVDRRGRPGRVGARARGAVRLSPVSKPLCAPGGGLLALGAEGRRLYLLGRDLQVRAEARVNALPDAQPAWMEGPNGPRVALLTDPTNRYDHGVLGDGLEAAALELYEPLALERVAVYRPEPPWVLEQLRVLPAGRGRVVVTRSRPGLGAGLVLLVLEEDRLKPASAAEPMGRSYRWLNAFAVAGPRVYAVHTPHIGGPLAVYDLPELEVLTYDLGVTNHTLGSRNLDQGRLLGRGTVGDVLVLPTSDGRALRTVVCTAGRCALREDHPLSARLSSNLAVVESDSGWWVYAADQAGGLHRFQVPR